MDVDTLARPRADGSPSDTGDADESQTIGAPPQSGEDIVPPQADPADESTPQPPAAEAAPRSLKLVVSLARDSDGRNRAVIALGSDGCDPLLRAIEADGLEDALRAIPGLLAEAEERWAHQPRYPVAQGTSTAASGSARTPSPRASIETAEQTGAPAPRPGDPGQMTLFA